MPPETMDELMDRTEQPTELRLREARRRGHVPRSADLTAAAGGVGAIVVLGLAGAGLLRALTRMTAALLDGRAAGIDPADAWGALLPTEAAAAAGMVGGALVAAAAVAALMDLLQVGPLVATERIRPDASRLSPAAAVSRLWSARTLVRAGFVAAKVAVAAAAGWWALRPALPRLARAGLLDAWALAAEAGRAAWSAAFAVGAGLLALGAADWLYQRWQHRQDLRMSRRELREEMRSTEGDWRLRRRRRDMGRKLGDWRPAREASAATLVVYDPRGWAVALRYGPGDGAPRVAAKGGDWSALRIRRTAEAAGVPLVADPAVAREICRRCRTGQEVPESVYESLARWMAERRDGAAWAEAT